MTISSIVLTWGADKEKERKWHQRKIRGSEENIDLADAKATDKETQHGKLVPTTVLRCGRDDVDGQHDSCKYQYKFVSSIKYGTMCMTGFYESRKIAQLEFDQEPSQVLLECLPRLVTRPKDSTIIGC